LMFICLTMSGFSPNADLTRRALTRRSSKKHTIAAETGSRHAYTYPDANLKSTRRGSSRSGEADAAEKSDQQRDSEHERSDGYDEFAEARPVVGVSMVKGDPVRGTSRYAPKKSIHKREVALPVQIKRG